MSMEDERWMKQMLAEHNREHQGGGCALSMVGFWTLAFAACVVVAHVAKVS